MASIRTSPTGRGHHRRSGENREDLPRVFQGQVSYSAGGTHGGAVERALREADLRESGNGKGCTRRGVRFDAPNASALVPPALVVDRDFFFVMSLSVSFVLVTVWLAVVTIRRRARGRMR